MITDIIDILHSNEFYNVSKEVELAKGKKEYISSFRDMKNKIKRQWRLKK